MKLDLKLLSTFLILFILLSLNTCTKKAPQLSNPHVPKIRDEINTIIKQLQSADLNTISINGNIKGIFDYKGGKQHAYNESLFKGQKIKRVRDTSELLTTKELNELIDKISQFKIAHISTLKCHDYETKYCNENIALKKWTIKGECEKDLIECREYIWRKVEKRIYYNQSYKIITRKNSPNKLEIFEPNLDENLSIKLDDLEIKILPEVARPVQKDFKYNIYREMQQAFLSKIENCK